MEKSEMSRAVVHPRHPTHLVGSKWSRVMAPEEEGYCHWEVIAFHKGAGEVVMRATLDRGAEQRLGWRELRDRTRWEPGWR